MGYVSAIWSHINWLGELNCNKMINNAYLLLLLNDLIFRRDFYLIDYVIGCSEVGGVRGGYSISMLTKSLLLR